MNIKNNIVPPYTKDGKLNPKIERGKPIYECNSMCSCTVSCSNRVVQKGINLNCIVCFVNCYFFEFFF